jgi:hypothetical protein
MVKSRDQNAGRSHNVKFDNTGKSSEKVEKFKYLRTTLTNQNSIREDQIEVRGMLTFFGVEYFVFQFATFQI